MSDNEMLKVADQIEACTDSLTRDHLMGANVSLIVSALRAAAASAEPVAWRWKWRWQLDGKWSLAPYNPGFLPDAEVTVEPLYTHPAPDAEIVAALEFYRDAWTSKPSKMYGGLEWSPKEELLEDCGERAKAALTKGMS